ncbi:tRNA pseudouridine(38-40) synthase TruA [Thermomicrobiaceae bacterium CFH 74404]|uniref:tRNA pseudouridine synthase A n=1 Tax=Thermalbibacter longus TaxID=2951981 RepID=A0AA41WHH5_9BACT|nr:tRNA pseudouridine(38-40) synthase TruA [Thermalbibacter longus]MCM8750550.1 tRNA pseudouridine(38-40) synthase TruA [Thermalbibacter longus]
MGAQLFRIDFGYDGTEFAGSQRQPGRRTVQGVLEEALGRLTGGPVTLVLAGRTDRGVHAVGQVASGELAWKRGPEELARALNAVLPDDVVVYRVQPVPPGFNARRSARYREYRYRIWSGHAPPLLLRRYAWRVCASLDVEAMQAAAAVLVGTRDLRSFAGKGLGIPGSGKRSVRTITVARWRPLEQSIDRVDRGARLLEFQIGADAFLPHMVRNIVGAMVAVGTGERTPDWLGELLEARDRRLAPPPAPPQGLVLWRVAYSGEELDERPPEPGHNPVSYGRGETYGSQAEEESQNSAHLRREAR